MVLFNLYDDWLKSISSYTVSSNILISILNNILITVFLDGTVTVVQTKMLEATVVLAQPIYLYEVQYEHQQGFIFHQMSGDTMLAYYYLSVVATMLYLISWPKYKLLLTPFNTSHRNLQAYSSQATLHRLHQVLTCHELQIYVMYIDVVVKEMMINSTNHLSGQKRFC